jgi:pyruvate dehydrogenase E1 component beta subunit
VAAHDAPLPVAPIMEQAVVPSVERIMMTIRGVCK